MDEQIRQKAYEKWEAEGRPEGHHERHWAEAEAEVRGETGDLPKTWSSDHAGGVAPPSTAEKDADSSASDAIPQSTPGSFKPGELASENK
ncbi:DUF2934 domain-containing protein [Rhizobium sp. S152]|uniref:DUF2934 domain-containing protein n=1 Tax=Rhizobium sp. S152 TaxID=3055038 RepID=UPI0025A9F371|nr:DUF2934 domain-containing protein [Rhizobium sp. S152]MDM9627667.1 DUF2934 domain-containing protein [Rhizobium sp. S152]